LCTGDRDECRKQFWLSSAELTGAGGAETTWDEVSGQVDLVEGPNVADEGLSSMY
jgi:hypothetical protein